MLKILLLGPNGQVGACLKQKLLEGGFQVVAIDRRSLDLSSKFSAHQLLDAHSPSVVINAAAYTAVDDSEKNPMIAMAVNANAVGQIAEACAYRDVPLIHLSTDYVFNGKKMSAYRENDAACPINKYGESKALGEQLVRNQLQKHIIIRTSWVFSENGKNFVNTIRSLGKKNKCLRIVNDQIGGPTSAESISKVIYKFLERIDSGHPSIWGTFHFCGHPYVTWYEFAEQIFKKSSMTVDVQPCASDEFPTIARRPRNSKLNNEKILKTLEIEKSFWIDDLI